MLVKLIWDFRGPTAEKTAKLFELRLQEYMVNEELEPRITGIKSLSPRHAIAYMVIPEFRLQEVKKELKPQRGEYYEMV